MYTQFFGLTEKPFTITPDPRYLFMSRRHAEALAHLVYGVTESDGFIQLTGEVGTGKTTLIRSLLQQLPEKADVALILNPQLSAREFLAAICEELGAPPPAGTASPKTLVDALNRRLLSAHARGRRTILIVDEAQNLAAEVLEQVRLLTNLETARQKLLQIILIGQPELRQVLARNDLRQLAQRVTGRYHLEPLSRDETAEYIDHRLRVAGVVGELFSPGAKREIYRLSNGIPRLINVICDRALLGAYSREQRHIDTRLVRRAAAEVTGQNMAPAWQRWLATGFGIAGVAVIVLGFWSFANEGRLDANARGAAERSAAPQPISRPARSALELAGGQVAPITVAEAAPAAARSEPSAADADLDRLLARHRDVTGNDTAFGALLGLWGLDYRPQGGPACEQARAQGLDCYFQRGSWAGIRLLDRPVIITLTGGDGARHQAVVTGLGEDEAELLIGEESMTVSLAALSDYWFGEYLLVWRPPNGEVKAFRPGMRDEGVLWLRQSLAAIQGEPVAPLDSPEFDEAVEARVKAYQRDRRLEVDGLVGPQTQIIMNSDLGLEGTPRLARAD